MHPTVTSWTIPTPHGLWYRAVIVFDRGLFLTHDMDVSSMKRVNAAALQGTKVLVSELLEHDRFKKPAFAPLDQIAAIRAKPTLGMLEIEAGGTILSARIPKRERLNEVAREVSDAIRVARAAAAT